MGNNVLRAAHIKHKMKIHCYILTLVLGSCHGQSAPASPWTWVCEAGQCLKTEVDGDHASPPSRLFTLGNSTIGLNPSKVSVESNLLKEDFQKAVDWQKSFLVENDKGEEMLIKINIASDDLTLNSITMEDYNLTVTGQDVSISASDYFGARHGIETLFQTIVWDEVSGAYVRLSDIRVEDRPEFPHRGLSLDTVRNFISIEKIIKVVDSLSFSKMNVFHWHITDTQSFPLHLPSLPEFSRYGAYSADRVYSPEEVRDLVTYARERGVRVIPELDAPAHVGAGWESVNPNFTVCRNAQPWEDFCVQPPCGQLNPAEEGMYDVLGTVFGDMLEMFRPDTFHMGGDEIHIGCWRSSSQITDWLEAEGKGTTDEDFIWMWSQFQNKSYSKLTAASNGRIPEVILWSSHLTNEDNIHNLDPNVYTIQVWADSSDCEDTTIRTVAEGGFRMIVSNSDATYLDCGYAGWVTDGNNWCSPYKGWQDLYKNNPYDIMRRHGVEESLWTNIMGGEAAIWSEQISEDDVLSKMEPRTAAYGERLWLGDQASSWHAAHHRLVHHRDRLVSRGVTSDQITQRWCVLNPGQCLLPYEGGEEVDTCDTSSGAQAWGAASAAVLIAMVFTFVLQI